MLLCPVSRVEETRSSVADLPLAIARCESDSCPPPVASFGCSQNRTFRVEFND